MLLQSRPHAASGTGRASLVTSRPLPPGPSQGPFLIAYSVVAELPDTHTHTTGSPSTHCGTVQLFGLPRPSQPGSSPGQQMPWALTSRCPSNGQERAPWCRTQLVLQCSAHLALPGPLPFP